MNFAPLFQSFGDLGSQYGQAKMDAAEFRLKQFIEQLRAQQGQAGLAESQERLRRLKLEPDTPEAALNARIEAIRKQAGSMGFTLGESDYRKLLGLSEPPVDRNAVKAQIAEMAKAAPEQMREPIAMLSREIDLLPPGADPLPVLEKAQSLFAQADKAANKTIDIKTVPGTSEPWKITDRTGKDWNVNDPNLPADLKGELSSFASAQATGEKKKAIDEARRSAIAEARAMRMLDAREQQKEEGKLLDVARRGIAGHTYLKAVAQEVSAAEQTPGMTGTTSGDRVIAEGFMQLMFGPEAKGIRGSTAVMDSMLQQGGWTDQGIAKLNNALSGGRLSQDVRKQILETSQRQVGIWDGYVQQYGWLTENDRTKNVISHYWKAVTEGNDLSDLGGNEVK
jgi:hypothetical protein